MLRYYVEPIQLEVGKLCLAADTRRAALGWETISLHVM